MFGIGYSFFIRCSTFDVRRSSFNYHYDIAPTHSTSLKEGSSSCESGWSATCRAFLCFDFIDWLIECRPSVIRGVKWSSSLSLMTGLTSGAAFCRQVPNNQLKQAPFNFRPSCTISFDSATSKLSSGTRFTTAVEWVFTMTWRNGLPGPIWLLTSVAIS